MRLPLIGLTVVVAVATAAVPAAAASRDGGVTVSASFAHAMARDLGIEPSQVDGRLAAELRAAKTEEAMRGALGESFGGAWFQDGTLNVAITDKTQASRVRRAGATPKLVKRNASHLDGVKRKLDSAPRPAPSAINSWYVDPATNSVVVVAQPGAGAAVKEFVAAGGVDPSGVTVESAASGVRTALDNVPIFEGAIYGGVQMILGQGVGCSNGFGAISRSFPSIGIITAGHCGTVGTPVDLAYTAVGTVRNSVFPGSGDMAYVSHDNYDFEFGPFIIQQVADLSNGGAIPVDGLTEAAVGASVCRVGWTTGTRCGQITARNITVNYIEGTVVGLTRTSACGEPGDSGGPFLAGGQAQGILSGADFTGCRGSRPSTFFQPVRPILRAFNLELMTMNGYMPG